MQSQKNYQGLCALVVHWERALPGERRLRVRFLSNQVLMFEFAVVGAFILDMFSEYGLLLCCESGLKIIVTDHDIFEMSPNRERIFLSKKLV